MSSSPSDILNHRRFWAYAASFGALWGAMEATLGVFFHALRLPLTGLALSALSVFIASAQRSLIPRPGITLATALIAAICRAITPSTALLGPLVAIALEGALLELGFLVLRSGTPGAMLGGSLAVCWSMSQGVVVKVLLYGESFVDLVLEAGKRFSNLLGLGSFPWTALATTLFVPSALLGALAGFLGVSYGKRLKIERERKRNSP